MGNISYGPCGGKKRRKSSSQAQRNGVASATSQRKSDILGAGGDSASAGSTGYGSYAGVGGSGYGLGSLSYGLECPEGIDEDIALLATAATLFASLYILYRQIELALLRRRKRSLPNDQKHSLAGNNSLNQKGRGSPEISNTFESWSPGSQYEEPDRNGFLNLLEGSPLWTTIHAGNFTQSSIIYKHFKCTLHVFLVLILGDGMLCI